MSALTISVITMLQCSSCIADMNARQSSCEEDLYSFSPDNWRRPLGRHHITWFSRT